ncbi:MAG: twin-arginine translocation signal domain-containing protein [Acidimicrobiales bacterium]
MASFSDEARPRDAGGTSGRRDFLRKAGVVGTGAFAVPMIVTVDPADAQALTSPPPEAPGRPDSPPVDAGGGTASPPGTQRAPRATGKRVTGRTELPRTGADLDRLVVAGLAATAGGAALVLWSAEARAAAAKPTDPTPDS